MPNWVFNHLSVEGNAKDVKKLKNQLNKPITKHYKEKDEDKPTTYSNPIFSFWNIIAPPDDKLDEYFGTHGFSDGERQGDTAFNWYNFNNREWGTKWDVAVADGVKYSETEITTDEPTCVAYRFDTAWSPPLPAIAKLAEQNPNVKITIRYEEEGGWGGEIEFQGEESEILSEWDEPNSHADYVALDREDSCNCANETEQEYWYDDCPGKKSKPIILSVVKDTIIAKVKDLTEKKK